jgi:hypothetical protein
MILQVEGHTIWQLYIMGGRRLPFAVMHKSIALGIWKRDAIVSIHRRLGVGKIDKVLMYHLGEHRATTDLYPVLFDAQESSRRSNKLGILSPSLCGLFDEPIWFRFGPGYRIVKPIDNAVGDATLEG